jgi:hypothetical protein
MLKPNTHAALVLLATSAAIDHTSAQLDRSNLAGVSVNEIRLLIIAVTSRSRRWENETRGPPVPQGTAFPAGSA